jgi:hypothetical protein
MSGKTHRVSVSYWAGDVRPSRKAHDAPLTGHLLSSWYTDVTERGALTVFGRERNNELRRLYQVGTEYVSRSDQPDRLVGYFVCQYEGITYTTVVVRELWPRYVGMYDN